MFGYSIAVRQGVCQCDGGAEALDRRIDVGAEKHVVLAVRGKDQGGVAAGTEDSETGVG